MKVADVRLMWIKSPSTDVDRVEVVTTINGDSKTVEVGPEVEDFMIEVNAQGSVSFKILTYDKENNVASSEVYSFTVSDLEKPQPATNLTHEIVGIRDVGVDGPPPEPPQTTITSRVRNQK